MTNKRREIGKYGLSKSINWFKKDKNPINNWKDLCNHSFFIIFITSLLRGLTSIFSNQTPHSTTALESSWRPLYDAATYVTNGFLI
jgi:hypothetical protein